MNIPWKLKSTAFAVVDVVGERPLYLAQKYVTGRSRKKIGAIKPSWIFHRDNLAGNDCRSLVEFGAGKSLAQNIYISELGIEQFLVDLNPMLDISLINRAIESLAELGVKTSGGIDSLADLQRLYGITYRAPLDMQNTGRAAHSLDACISTNTLEHIPADVIAGIWTEVRRIVRPGGLVSAKIDYSDHYAHTDRSLSPLNYLQFSESEWRRHNHACHFQNRLRHRHHLDLMRDAGLVIRSERCDTVADPGRLSLNAALMTGSDTDYCTDGFIVAVTP